MAEGDGLLNRYTGLKPVSGVRIPLSPPAPVHARPLPSSFPSIDRHLAAEASVAVRLGSWQAVVRNRRTSWPPRRDDRAVRAAKPGRHPDGTVRRLLLLVWPAGAARRTCACFRHQPNPRRRRPVYFRHKSRARNSTPCACCFSSVAATNLMLYCCAASAGRVGAGSAITRTGCRSRSRSEPARRPGTRCSGHRTPG